jgi:thiamine-monophosphate kinase
MVNRPRLGPGGEFDRIRRVLGAADPLPAEVLVGPGDDAAVLAPDLVLSTDMALEGVHFRLDWISPQEAAARAVGAAVSDLAAMGASLVGTLVSVALPGGSHAIPGGEAFLAGLRDRTQSLGGHLLGGDLTRAPGQEIVVDVVAVGRTTRPLLRSGASPGDELWVTGTLGAAATAVDQWMSGEVPHPSLRQAYARPEPRLAPARWLVEAGATAGLDLSDGLAGDAGHLAAASGVQVILDEGAIPLPAHGPISLGSALHGGEDFELLVALPRGSMDSARVEEFLRSFDLGITCVGRVGEGEGVVMTPASGGSPQPLTQGGYDHFREEREARP